ncbi:hypothetical protein EON66_05310 [archaeon]|nr:MAG: hypothetical protein EON66_05310 [archaeon]
MAADASGNTTAIVVTPPMRAVTYTLAALAGTVLVTALLARFGPYHSKVPLVKRYWLLLATANLFMLLKFSVPQLVCALAGGAVRVTAR